MERRLQAVGGSLRARVLKMLAHAAGRMGFYGRDSRVFEIFKKFHPETFSKTSTQGVIGTDVSGPGCCCNSKRDCQSQWSQAPG
jgi:hypothetical protein